MTISLKQFIIQEAQKHSLTASAIRMRISRGLYPNLKLIRKNKRVIDVEV